MKFSRPRFRPELISLEDRCVPAVVFTSPAVNPGVFTVLENTTAVTTAVASEAGNTIGYTMQAIVDGGTFNVGFASGAISFNAAPNFEAPTDVAGSPGGAGNNVYSIRINGTGAPSGNTTTQDFTITVLDVVELVNGGTVQAVNAAENQIAQILFDADPAAGEAAGTTFTLSGPDAARFTINAAGQLTFINGPFLPELPGQIGRDFERPSDANLDNVYNVVITGNRAGANNTQAVSSVTVNVTVTNVVENTVTGGQFSPLLVSGNPQGFFPPFLQTTGGFAGVISVPGPTNPIPLIPGANIAPGAGFYIANFAVIGGGAAGATFTFPFLFI